ncbi:MAG: single-stranded-DNA-specific exonuclease RecJ [Polyangiaceae bacterium]
MVDRRFGDPGPASDEAMRLATELGLSFTVGDVLHRRGIEAGEAIERWLAPKLGQLTSPEGMADREVATLRIAKAIREGESIAVFGDYDCDGITAAAILTEGIVALGGKAEPFLASRFAGGYGFSMPALDRVLSSGATLLITCDCGSSDHERLQIAMDKGLDAVVVDHHLVPDKPLPAVAFLNPHRPECGFPYKGLASCGLALSVIAALRKELDVKLDVRRWLDLVAIGTVADVAPLDGDNRVLVRKGLEVIDRGARVGLAALVSRATRGRPHPMSSEDIAFQIAPRINAPGRLGAPDAALALLLEQDPARAAQMADAIEEQTVLRREIQKQMIAEALEEIARQGYAEDAAIMLAREGWHAGVVGIVAGRIADEFGKPTVIASIEGDEARGSVRGPSGFRLHDALTASSGELTKFGGHQAAAGVEMRADNIAGFREAWCRECAAQIAEAPPVEETALAEVRLDPRDDVGAVLADLEQLEPCGEGNRPPKLLFGQVRVLEARVVGGDHLKLSLDVAGKKLSAFAPGMAEVRAQVRGKAVTLVGRLKRDHWRGGRLPEVLVEAMIPLA